MFIGCIESYPRYGMRRLLAGMVALVIGCIGIGTASAAQPVRVVAAESSYGAVVKAIGGDHVAVVSLLDSPGVNPHEFKGTPRIGRQLQDADLVVVNGLGYDGWMTTLLKGTPSEKRHVVNASRSASNLIMADKNPHVFYDPRIMLATAVAVTEQLQQIDPEHRADYAAGLERFRKSLRPVYARLQRLVAAHPNLTVTSTEPIYGYMLRLLGYRSSNQAFQLAAMNGTEPGAQQVGQFIRQLKQHKVALLIYNSQVQTRLTQSLVAAAEKAGVPTVAVSEIPLHGEDYAQWQIQQLDAVTSALSEAGSNAP